MKLHEFVHDINHTLPLPRRVRWMLLRYVRKHSNIPSQLNNVRINQLLFMDLDMNEPVDELIYFNVMDHEIIKEISRYVRKDDTVIDIGANIGYFSLLMAHQVGPNGIVHSFEPIPVIAERLVNYAYKNKYDKIIKIHNLAISDACGNTQFYLTPGHLGHSSLAPETERTLSSIEVRITTLDELYTGNEIGRPTFIKIDIEGAELFALKGGEKLIQDCRPVIVSEIGRYQKISFHYPTSDIWKWADAHDYSFTFLHPYLGYQQVALKNADTLPDGNVLLKPRELT